MNQAEIEEKRRQPECRGREESLFSMDRLPGVRTALPVAHGPFLQELY